MIAINQLRFGYNKHKPLFKDLSLSLPAGQVCGLLGKNGAGKTTLLKLIAGLVFPQQGECQVLGYPCKSRHPRLLESMFFIPEDFYIPALTAKQYVNSYALFYPKFDSRFFEQAMTEFALPMDKKLHHLSLGQKKKFILAFGLATQCSLMILDEPTNGLDIQSKSQFRKLLAQCVDDDKLIVISTHQTHDISHFLDHLVIVDEGRVILNTSMANLAKRLDFTIQNHQPDAEDCIYAEKNLYGYKVITENTSEADTVIDIETLFNAVVMNQQKIISLFNEVKQ